MNVLTKNRFVFTISKSQKDLGPLYFLFLIFALTAPFRDSPNILYTQNIFTILVVYVFGIRHLKYSKFKNHLIAISLYVLFLILLQYLNYEIYVYVLIFKLFILYQYFKYKDYNIYDIVLFINITYILYLSLSYLAYFNVIDISQFGSINTFEEGRFLFDIETLYGFGGSVASIDSYSGFIVVLNLMFNTKWRGFYIATALFSLLLTTRLTPLVAGVASILYYYFIPLGLNYMVMFILVTLLTIIIWLKSQPDPIKFFFAAISTNRSLIWTDQFQIFLDRLTPVSAFFAKFEGVYNIKVYGFEKITNNPHNSYLYLMYNSLAGFIFILSAFIKGAAKIEDKRFKTVIFFILIASLTNVHIIGLRNPSYIIFIVYSIDYFNNRLKRTKKCRLYY